MRRYLLAFTLLLALLAVVLSQQPITATAPAGTTNDYLPLISKAPLPTATPTATATPTPTPTVTPVPYPRTPWSVQEGSTVYEFNPSNYWLQGSILLLDGEPAVGDKVQICNREATACTGPSAPSRPSHNGVPGYYDWVNFNGGGPSSGDGRYFAVVVDCSGYQGNPQDSTLGNWPLCTEHSPRVNFTVDSPDQRVVTINWQRVAE